MCQPCSKESTIRFPCRSGERRRITCPTGTIVGTKRRSGAASHFSVYVQHHIAWLRQDYAWTTNVDPQVRFGSVPWARLLLYNKFHRPHKTLSKSSGRRNNIVRCDLFIWPLPSVPFSARKTLVKLSHVDVSTMALTSLLFSPPSYMYSLR
jgi:hypothetical protein